MAELRAQQYGAWRRIAPPRLPHREEAPLERGLAARRAERRRLGARLLGDRPPLVHVERALAQHGAAHLAAQAAVVPDAAERTQPAVHRLAAIKNVKVV